MIVKGLIKTIDFNDNSCMVRIPLFETAASRGEVVLKAIMLVQPGMYNGFVEGDVVFVDFENEDLGQPIVIGKLYLGAAKEASATAHSALSVSNLEVTSKATLPIDTRIVVEDIGSTVPVENGITSYKTISDIIKALYRTEAATDQVYKDQSEMITTIKVEYLSQPADAEAPIAENPNWSTSTPGHTDGYFIWQKTTCYNNRGQVLSIEIICLSEVSAIAYYRLRCSSKLHAAKNQTEPITITAMVKLGSNLEVKDEAATIAYKWSGEDTETLAGPEVSFSASDLKEGNLIITMLREGAVCDTETIQYAPLNTPALILSNDTDSITYAANGSTILSDPVSSTAKLYLNGEVFSDTEVRYDWELINCAEIELYDPYFIESRFIEDTDSVTVKSISSRSKSGQAICRATVLRSGAFNGNVYEKTFTVAQTRVGENSTSYWLTSSCTVHTGKKHDKPVVITAMKQYGTEKEVIDTASIIWWKYASDTEWTQAVEIVTDMSGDEPIISKIHYRLPFYSVNDEDIIVLATHESSFDPNELDEASLILHPAVYEREEIPFSPLNTPIINLTNDMGAFVCKSDGTKLNKEDVTKTTAELWLNGSKLTAGVSYKWDLVDCETDTGLTSIASANLTVKDIYADVATATCTATYQGEPFTKVFKVVKQYQGRSPYIIDVYNDFVSLPTNEEGKIPEAFLDEDLIALTTHTLSCYYGDEPLTIDSYSTETPTTADDIYRVSYTVDTGITLSSDFVGPSFAVTAVADTLSVGSVKYELYKGTTKLATAKFELIKQKQGVSATSFWVDYTARVHRGTNQQDNITATAWSKFGNNAAVENTDLYFRYGWRNTKGTFDYCANTEITRGKLTVLAEVPSVDDESIKVSNFKNADLVFELGTWDEDTQVFTTTDSELITYSPSNTPVLDLSNDSATLPYRTSGKKFGDGVVVSTATLYLDGQILTEGVTYTWTPLSEANTATEVIDGGNLIGHRLSVSELTSDTMEFTCTATLDNKKLFKDKVELSKVFTVSKQIQGENSISYWLKLSNGVHLGTNQKNTITVTAMRKIGTELIEDIDESAKLFYQFKGDSFWFPVEVPVAGEPDKYMTHCLTLNPEELPEGFVFKDRDLLIKAIHTVIEEVAGEEQEKDVEYETEAITYSPLNTPVLDLDNDTDTILYPAKPEDDLVDSIEFIDTDGTKKYIGLPLGAPVKSKATLYLNGDAFANTDVEYTWKLTNCVTDIDLNDTATTVTGQEVTVAAFTTEDNGNVAALGRATCTAKILAAGPFQNKLYTKVFTVSKTRKGDNAVVYSLAMDHADIILDPNTSTLDPKILTGICQTHDGNSIQPYGLATYKYKFDTATTYITKNADEDGTFSIPLTQIIGDGEAAVETNLLNSKVEICLLNAAGTIVDKETVKIVKDGLNGSDGAPGAPGVSILSQTTYYALIHNKYEADSIAAPESDETIDLIVKAKAGNTLNTTGANKETLGAWNTTPPAQNNDTNGWKYWTTVRTEFSNETVTFSNPIINEDLSGVYALAQGKTTNYYSNIDPIKAGYDVKEGDCWFYTPEGGGGYIYEEASPQPSIGQEHLYVGYYITTDELNPAAYIEVTADNLDEFLSGDGPITIEAGKTKCYERKIDPRDTNTLYQWNGSDWEDIGSEIVAKKVTAQFINGFDITAKRIKITDTDNSTLFEADGIDGNHIVTIGGFEVEKNVLTTGNTTTGNLIKLSSNNDNVYTVGNFTPAEKNSISQSTWGNSGWAKRTDGFQRKTELSAVEHNNTTYTGMLEYSATNNMGVGSAGSPHYYAITKVTFKVAAEEFKLYLTHNSGDINDYMLASVINPSGGIPNSFQSAFLQGTTYNNANQLVEVSYSNIKPGNYFYIVYVHGSGVNTWDGDWATWHNHTYKGTVYMPTNIRLTIGDNFQVLADGTVYAKNLFLGSESESTTAGMLSAVKIISGGEGQKKSLNDDSLPGVYFGPDGLSIGTGFKVEAGGSSVITNIQLTPEQMANFTASSYWLASSCTVHTGTKHNESITVSAMKQTGNRSETTDTGAYLWWKYAFETDWQLASPAHNYLDIPAADIKDADIYILATHQEGFDPNKNVDLSLEDQLYEKEEISFSPLNVPILNLTNDSAALTYNGTTKVGSNTVSATAELWFNGKKIESDSDLSFDWTLNKCTGTKSTNAVSNDKITIRTLSDNVATATCIATYKGEEYRKDFTIVKQLQGADSTSYWVSCSTPVHTGHNQTEPIVITAMKKKGNSSEGQDSDATIYYKYANAAAWQSGAKGSAVTLTTIEDKDLIISARHGSAESSEYDRETITYSPLNTPIIDLSNDSAAIVYEGNSKLGDSVSSTAGVYLNGSLVNDQMEILWLTSDCTAELNDNQVNLKDAGTLAWYNASNTGPSQVIKVLQNPTITISSIVNNKTNAVASCWAFEKLYLPDIFVYRPSFTETAWATYGTIGHTELWDNTPTVTLGNYFVVLGKSTDTNQSHVLWYKSTAAAGTAYGECVAHKTFYEKDFTITKQLKGLDGTSGTSPVALEIENDFDSIPCDHTGTVLYTAQQYSSQTAHTLRLFEGITAQPFKILASSAIADRPDDSSYFVVYDLDGVTADLAATTEAITEYTARITQLNTDKGKIKYTVYKGKNETVLATGYFRAEKRYNVEPSVKIDVINDFVSIPCSGSGAISWTSEKLQEETEHTIYVYEGVTPKGFIVTTSVPTTNDAAYRVHQVATGLTVAKTSSSHTTSYTNHVSELTSGNSVGTITYNLYKGTTLVGSGKFEAIKAPAGTNGESYKLLSGESQIKRNKQGEVSPSSITFNALKQVGSGAVSAFTGAYFKVYKDGALYYQGQGMAKSDGTLSTVSTGTYVFTATTTTTKNLKVELYSSSSYSTLLDCETIPVVTDGADGEDLVDYYLLADYYQVAKNPNTGSYNPSTVTFTVYKQIGTASPIVMDSSARGDLAFSYKINEAAMQDVPATGTFKARFGSLGFASTIKVALYIKETDASGNPSYTLVDTESITVLSDGLDGSIQGAVEGRSIVSMTTYYTMVSNKQAAPSAPMINPPPEWLWDYSEQTGSGWSVSPPSYIEGCDYYETVLTIYNSAINGKNFSWSTPVKSAMLSVDFLNTLGITSKKLEVKSSDGDQTVFLADGFKRDANGNLDPTVEIGGFNITENGIYSTNGNIRLESNGELFAKNASLNGVIEASMLNIASRNLTAGWLTDYGVYLPQKLDSKMFTGGSTKVVSTVNRNIQINRIYDSSKTDLEAVVELDKPLLEDVSITLLVEVNYWHQPLNSGTGPTTLQKSKIPLSITHRLKADGIKTAYTIPICRAWTESTYNSTSGWCWINDLEEDPNSYKIIDFFPKQFTTTKDYATDLNELQSKGAEAGTLDSYYSNSAAIELDAALIPVADNKFKLGKDDGGYADPRRWKQVAAVEVRADKIVCPSSGSYDPEGNNIRGEVDFGASKVYLNRCTTKRYTNNTYDEEKTEAEAGIAKFYGVNYFGNDNSGFYKGKTIFHHAPELTAGLNVSGGTTTLGSTNVEYGLTVEGTATFDYTATFKNTATFNGTVNLKSTVKDSGGSTIHNSDKNVKNTIQYLSEDEKYEKLFDKLQPVSYKLNNGTSGRTHIGLIAQDLKQAILEAGLTTEDVAAYCEWEPEEDDPATCGIRYEEFISLSIHEIQKLKAQVAQQNQLIADLTQRLEKLESKN